MSRWKARLPGCYLKWGKGINKDLYIYLIWLLWINRDYARYFSLHTNFTNLDDLILFNFWYVEFFNFCNLGTKGNICTWFRSFFTDGFKTLLLILVIQVFTVAWLETVNTVICLIDDNWLWKSHVYLCLLDFEPGFWKWMSNICPSQQFMKQLTYEKNSLYYIIGGHRNMPQCP